MGSAESANAPATSSHRQHPGQSTSKMPSTPQMRKANEKNAKNVTKRGQVKGLARTQTSTPSVQNLSPSLSLLSSALPSSKSFSPCGWLDRRCNQSTPAALSRGLWLDFPRSGFLKTENTMQNGGTMVAPVVAPLWHHGGTSGTSARNLVTWKSGLRSPFLGNPSAFASP